MRILDWLLGRKQETLFKIETDYGVMSNVSAEDVGLWIAINARNYLNLNYQITNQVSGEVIVPRPVAA